MDYAQNVRVVNVSQTASPKLKKGLDASKYPRLDPGDSRIVPWSTAALWLGDPTFEGRNAEMETVRVRAFYGCAIEDADMPSRLPDFEVYDLETGDRVPTVCDILLGKDVQVSVADEPVGDLRYVMDELKRLRGENDLLSRQMTMLEQGRSIANAEGVAAADDTEPMAVGVTSADTPKVARGGRSAG